jgi:hypothetical protein
LAAFLTTDGRVGGAGEPGIDPVGDAAQVLGDVGAAALHRIVVFADEAVDQRLRGLAGVDVHGVDLVHLVLQLGQQLVDVGRDRLQGQLEGVADGVGADVLQQRDELLLVDEGERPAVEIDAAAAGPQARQLGVDERVVAPRRAHHEAAAGVEVHRLATEGAGRGDIAQRPQVVEHRLHLGIEIGGLAGGGGRRQRHASRQAMISVCESGGHRGSLVS